MNEISTSRSELKKLAQILVASDPSIFPPSERQQLILSARSAPEIRRMDSRAPRFVSNDPEHVHTIITSQLANFGFMNDPPTATVSGTSSSRDSRPDHPQGTFFASPVLEKLCKSFYEEDKWQRSLEYLIDENEEWSYSVTPKMVSFAATAVSIYFLGDTTLLSTI